MPPENDNLPPVTVDVASGEGLPNPPASTGGDDDQTEYLLGQQEAELKLGVTVESAVPASDAMAAHTDEDASADHKQLDLPASDAMGQAATGGQPPAPTPQTELTADALGLLRNEMRSEMGRELAKIKAQLEVGSTTSVAPIVQQQPTPSPELAEIEAAMGEITENYPEIAAPLVQMMERLRTVEAGMSNLKAPIETLSVMQRDNEYQRQVAVFETAHPDFQEFMKPDPRVNQWLAQQPAFVKEAVERGLSPETFDGAEQTWVLNQYKQHLAAIGATPPPPPPAPQSNHVRERQIVAAADVGGSSVTTAIAAGLDPNSYEAGIRDAEAKLGTKK